ncbi:MAG: D-alanine--D-alanine ligase [Deltaproteobacteria bacterium]|nr:D-alanine--D-alanine ligase [Deltaproteobacteria bacterium]
MRILLIAGGWSEEREVSLAGAEQIGPSLAALGHEVTCFDLIEGWGALVQAVQSMDFAYLNLHGTPGEDGSVQALLERLGVPYQGAGPAASMLALNKAQSKNFFVRAGIATPRWRFVPPGRQAQSGPPAFPCVVKPNAGGSSVGVSIVQNRQELDQSLKDPALAGRDLIFEEYVPGREVTCAVLGGEALPLILIKPRSGRFFDYREKYDPAGAEEICPAPIEDGLTREIQMLSLKAHACLGLADYSRADFIVDDDDRPHLLEVNTLPGMTRTSLLPRAAKAVGLDFSSLLARLLEMGMTKFGHGPV